MNSAGKHAQKGLTKLRNSPGGMTALRRERSVDGETHTEQTLHLGE